MKRIFAILLVGIMLLLPSCGKKVKKESVTPERPIGTVSTSYNGVDYTATIRYADTGVMTVRMQKPMKDLVISVSDSGCRLSYDGMELSYTAEQLEDFCPFIALYSVLKTVCYTVPSSARTDGENYVLKYRTPDLSCTAVSNRKDGTLSEIETKDIKFIFS